MISIYEDPELVKEMQRHEAGEEIAERPNALVPTDADSDTVWIVPASESDWLALKAVHVTSTESSALFGMSPYNTKFELWHRKKEGAVYQLEDNERMAWGRRLQDAIAKGVAEDKGWTETPFREFVYSRADRMGSSFDYQVYDPKRERAGILEIKNVDSLVFKQQWIDGEAPDHIEIQLQHQMEVSGYEWGCIAALVGGNRLELICRDRDRDMGAAIREEIRKFWQTIERGEEPKPDFEMDAETINRLYSKSGGGEVYNDDPRLEALAHQYMEAGEQYRASEALKDALAAEIKTIIGTADVCYARGIKISAKAVAENPGTVITPEMVGTVINARKGYRPLRVSKVKEKK